ncbi:flavin reductase (DIM6/NTAB) family NADH-FMN oxidoreductase RutF [Dysgonomonas hofstadii]|uniref:Flavin reductase (DIM6/NTAB) family NADH-FMN oxidoreductase RutF n=1 Tax=Dysgonomonas hofstadii TaxID=637886 RepID=A0A840CSZ1_9BACT|nr:DUF4468 domain-containing protein [Dysgonomonas hofstadii]MBB4037809.1 flavin reductase (DIM6/NTAB) family NADH-FMN oxidoreductase RutF [Dysgonomonas hofstadii]
MNKYLLISLCAFISLFANAQDNSKYLQGAVPEVDGKVIFTKSITVNNTISEKDLFDAMNKWAEDNYNTSDQELTNRVLLSDWEDRDIACWGEEYLTFRRSLLILDRAKMSYQLIISIAPNKCDLTVRNIRYEYSDYKTPVSAEELISDRIALNKKGDKLNRYYDKFRTHTIDSINNIFNSVDLYLNGKITTGIAAPVVNQGVGIPVTSQPVQTQQQQTVVEQVPVVATAMAGFKNVSADKIPASILNKQSLIVTGTASQPSAIPAIWAGTTTLLDKLMGLSTITHSAEVIDNAQTYTISFYTEIYSDAITEFETKGNAQDKIKKAGLTPITTPSGAPAFSEAWMIIECKKAGTMPSAGTSGDKTYLGEILNVWIK